MANLRRRGEKERGLLAALRKAHGKQGDRLGTRPVTLDPAQVSFQGCNA